jgi:hypothetical protein
MILLRAPRLIAWAMIRRDLNALALALDLAVPPLTFLALLTMGVLLLASMMAWVSGAYTALLIAAVSFTALVIAVALCWTTFARDILPGRAIWSVVPYALQKFGLYWNFLSGGRASRWTRTDRK